MSDDYIDEERVVPQKHTLVSRLPHPVDVAYNGNVLQIPPKAPLGKVVIDNKELLGSLPTGIKCVPYNE